MLTIRNWGGERAFPKVFKHLEPIHGKWDSCSFHLQSKIMFDTDAFLRQEVESASPAKLRWLLLQKAHGLTLVIKDHWLKGEAFEAKQWVIWVQDIFTELLAGVVDPKHELAQQQSDLYVYLSKLIIVADQSQDIEALDDLTSILEIEKGTWEMFVRRETQSQHATGTRIHADGEDTPASFSIEA